MKETPEELDALQRLLDDSAGRSGRHLIGIITKPRRLDATRLVNELTGMKVLVVATVTAAGEPRTSCVDGHFLHGTWLFSTCATAHKARDLKQRPAVSATYADGERMALFTHGYAEYIDQSHDRFPEFEQHFVAHYGSSPANWTPTPVFFLIRPKWMVGYAAQ